MQLLIKAMYFNDLFYRYYSVISLNSNITFVVIIVIMIKCGGPQGDPATVLYCNVTVTPQIIIYKVSSLL